MSELSTLFLTPEERRMASLLRDPRITERLVRAWARKEAVSRAAEIGPAAAVYETEIGSDGTATARAPG